MNHGMNARRGSTAGSSPRVAIELPARGVPAELQPVAAAAAALLNQCEEFIRGVPIAAYATESRTLKGGTIGKHIRHTLDHFRAALDGAPSLRGARVIDYDHRQREVPMETQPSEALLAIAGLREQLVRLDAEQLRAPVRIRVMLTGDGAETELGSTLARELAFAVHHAIHHHAMMGAIASEQGLAVAPEFGKAPSTIAHDRSR